MIRVAVVEDESAYRRQILDYLSQFEREHGEHFQITVFQDGARIAYGYKPEFDLILMDIELGVVSGMEAAEQIRRLDREVVIIFITNMPQYAMKGYEVEALDYVLKPVSYYAFAQRMERALKRMSLRRRQYITVSTGRGALKKLEVGELRYVEVQEHSLIYHTFSGTLTSSGTMREAERLLGDKGFFRCSKSFLVNLEHVDGMAGDDALIAGERVQISRARKKAFLDALNNHINEVSK